MTLYQTRQLGIEFERRLQAAVPSEEFINKLDTETIYSFLNEYQMQFVNSLLNSVDRLDSSTTVSAYVENILLSLLTSEVLDNSKIVEKHNEELDDNIDATTGRSTIYKLSTKCLRYIRSVSRVGSTYKEETENHFFTTVPNVYATQKDVLKLITGNPYDKLRIMRNPVVTLSEYNDNTSTLTVLYDRYTEIENVNIVYYKKPSYFSLMTSTPCELPMEVFEDLVNGAVQLYINYATVTQLNKSQREREAARQLKEIDDLANNVNKLANLNKQ